MRILRVTLFFISIERSRWIANGTGGSSKAVEQRDLEIYTLILLWRYVRRGGKKNKIETGRPLFPRPRILVKISRTLGGTGIENIHIRPLWWSLGPPSRSKLDDSSGLKGYCKTTHSRPIPLFFQTFFFLPSLPSWDPRDAVTTRWFFFENKFVYVIDWTGDDNPLYNSAIFH